MHVKARTPVRKDQQQLAGATGRMQAQKLIDLIDETAPEEGVVDLTNFANGSRRIPLTDDGAVVEAVVEGAADTTRRMSAVESDALVTMEIRSESTMRMSAIQANELVALITPEVSLEIANEVPAVEVSFEEPTVTFNVPPRIVMPIPAPAPAPEDEDDLAIPVEAAAPIVEPVHEPVRRSKGWMIFALLTLAGATAGLVLVALERI